MKTPRLIALSSPCMGSGKSELAGVLTAKYGYSLVKFADPLKSMARALFISMGFYAVEIDRMLEGDLKETALPQLKGRTPRHIIQTLGTEWGRVCINKGLWVHLAERRIELLLGQGISVVVDDCRFPNEAASILGLGGQVYMVTRNGATPYNDHPSEGLLDDLGLPVIDNSGSIEALRAKADQLAKGDI